MVYCPFEMGGKNRSSDSDDASRQLTQDIKLFNVIRKRPGTNEPITEQERWRNMDELLVVGGANVNAVDVNRNTVLHLAVKKGYRAIAKNLLMVSSIDISVKNNNGVAPLDLARLLKDRHLTDLLTNHRQGDKLKLANGGDTTETGGDNLKAKACTPCVDVDDDSIFRSVAVAFLTPVLQNDAEFSARFNKLFGVGHSDKEYQAHALLSDCNPATVGDVFLKLIETFQNNVTSKLSSQDQTTWSETHFAELVAISGMIDVTISVRCDDKCSFYGNGSIPIKLSYTVNLEGDTERGQYKFIVDDQIKCIDEVDQKQLDQHLTKTFLRRQGTSGMGGQLYEIELLMYFLLQGKSKIKDGKMCRFYLASNLERAEDFDDLVFKYEFKDSDGQARSKIIFLQAKHKENPEKADKITVEKLLSESDKGDFNLKKYFSCYRRLIRHFSLSKTADPIFRCNYEELDCDFIIFTNAFSKFSSKNENVEKIVIDRDYILNCCETPDDMYYYKINFNRNLRKPIYNVLKNSSDIYRLAKDLVKSIFSENGLDVDSGILKNYHKALSNDVIDAVNGQPGLGKLKESFLQGVVGGNDFRIAFFEELQKREEFSKKSIDNLEAELLRKTFKLPNKFGIVKEEKYLKQELPDDGVSEEEITEFLSKLKLFANQPNESTLSELIGKNVQLEFSLDEGDANLVISDVKNKVQKWWKEGNCFLTENNRLFEDAKQDLDKLSLVGLALERKSQIEKLDTRFAIQEIEELSKLIANKQIINIVTNNNTSLLSSLKVYQTLESMAKIKSRTSDFNYIFISLSTICSLQNKIINSFRSKQSVLLVIECNLVEENIDYLFEELSSIISQYSTKKIVLISRKSNVLANKFKDTFPEKYFEREDVNNNLVDLSSESKKRLLLEGVLSFQGLEVSLGDLVNDESMSIINGEVLSKLVICEKFGICNSLPSLGDIKFYYIDRTLNHHIKIKNIIEQDETKFFTITEGYLTSTSKPKNKDVVIISDNKIEFEEVCKELKEHNVHWLKKDKGNLIWQQSQGCLSNLHEYIDEISFDKFEPEKIFDLTDKVVIVAAEPGMGKSTLFTHLAEQTKFFDPSQWVIKIDLHTCTKILCETNFDNIDNAFNFLMAVIRPKTLLEIDLFRHRFYFQGKIVILFDGFDEISPNYKDKVIQLLQILKSSKIEKMWVSTRLHIRNELENRLSLFAYTLKPFSRFDQEKFLREFWRKYLNYSNINENRLNIFINDLLDLVHLSIRDQERQFTSVPLQTELLAKAFQENLKIFHDSDENILETDLPNKLDVLDLYQKFVESKYRERYLIEKRKYDLTQAGTEYETLFESFVKKHKLLSLSALFSEDNLDKLLPEDEHTELRKYTDEVKFGKENIGFIYQITDGEPYFIHRTFAEYFAAQWLAENFERQVVKEFLKEQIFKKENEVIRNFFDRILTKDDQGHNKYELHTAVLNNDKNRLIELLGHEKAANDINAFDKANRTALHLSAAYGFEDLVDILLTGESESNLSDMFNWSPLSYADMGLYWNIAEMLLKKGADGHCMIQAFHSAKEMVTAGKSPLIHEVAYAGHVEFTKVLIDLFAVDINLKNRNGLTPLHVATREGNLEIVKCLLERGANLKAKENVNSAPLHIAIQRGDVQIIDCLVMAGADLTQPNKFEPSLHIAVESGKIDVVKYLLSKCVTKTTTINKPNWIGETPLHKAAMWGRKDIVELLMENGAKLNVEDEMGNTPLHSASTLHKREVIRYLIDKGADVNVQNHDGNAIGYWAASWGDLLEMEYLASNGVDFTVAFKGGLTALHVAAENGHLNIVQYLVGIGVNVNESDNSGMTPLHKANQHLNVTRYLVEERNADFTIKTVDGSTALHFAARSLSWDVLKYLVEAGGNFKEVDGRDGCIPLHWAAQSGQMDVVILLVTEGSDLNSQDNNGKTALHRAARHGKLQIVDYLVSKGALVSLGDKWGFLPLHQATFYGFLHVAKYLVDNKLNDVNSKGNDESTPLYHAAHSGKLEVAIFLISEGAHLNACDATGTTPLHRAALKDDLGIVELLVSNGASVNAQDNDGITPLHGAVWKDRLDIVKYLLGKGAHINAEAGERHFSKSPLDFAERDRVKQFLVSRGAVTTRKRCVAQAHSFPSNYLRVIRTK